MLWTIQIVFFSIIIIFLMHYLFDFITVNMKIKLFTTIDETKKDNLLNENVGIIKENIEQLQDFNLIQKNSEIQNQNREILGEQKKVIIENNIISENEMRNELSKLISSKLDIPVNNNSTLISDLPIG